MIYDFQPFHRLVSELLEDIGFEQPVLASTQEVISIEIEGRFTVNFGLINQTCWFMLAEIMPTEMGKDTEHYPLWLRSNQMDGGEYQPTIGLDDNNQLICWLRLPLYGCNRPQMIAAFDATLATARQLLKYE